MDDVGGKAINIKTFDGRPRSTSVEALKSPTGMKSPKSPGSILAVGGGILAKMTSPRSRSPVPPLTPTTSINVASTNPALRNFESDTGMTDEDNDMMAKIMEETQIKTVRFPSRESEDGPKAVMFFDPSKKRASYVESPTPEATTPTPPVAKPKAITSPIASPKPIEIPALVSKVVTSPKEEAGPRTGSMSAEEALESSSSENNAILMAKRRESDSQKVRLRCI